MSTTTATSASTGVQVGVAVVVDVDVRVIVDVIGLFFRCGTPCWPLRARCGERFLKRQANLGKPHLQMP